MPPWPSLRDSLLQKLLRPTPLGQGSYILRGMRTLYFQGILQMKEKICQGHSSFSLVNTTKASREETMSDVALLISDGNGEYTRFGITRQSLKSLDVGLEANCYTYMGELYKITKGHSVSFSEIKDYEEGGIIEKCQAEIKLTL